MERAPLPTPVVIGILGGIAGGKSLAARLLAGPDGLVLDADRLAHEALTSPEIVARVVERFGSGVLDPQSGLPDRAALAQRAFSDPADRAALESWIHPRVRETIRTELAGARDRAVPRVVLDVPLLLENDAQHGLVRSCHVLVFVAADEARREERARRRRGWARGEVARREAAQLPLAEKRARADFVLENEGTAEDLERAARDLIESDAFRARVLRAERRSR